MNTYSGMRNIPNSSMASRQDILVWAQTAGLEALRAWLKWNDSNGEYDDSPEFGPLTRDAALGMITEQVANI